MTSGVINGVERIFINLEEVYTDFVVYNSRGVVFMLSIIGYYGPISKLNIMRDGDSFVLNGYRLFLQHNMKKRMRKISDDLYQLIYIYEPEQRDSEYATGIFAVGENEEAHKVFMDTIYDKTNIPMAREWSEFLFDSLLEEENIVELCKTTMSSLNNTDTFYLYKVDSGIIGLIESGIKSGFLRLGDNDIITDEFREMEGLDDYLELFSEDIASEIEKSFTPKFVPGEDKYSPKLLEFDKYAYDKGINLFEEQKNVIQAVSNNLDHNNTTFLIGEMGTGKTLMGAAIPYVHSREKASTSIVMCPSHLVNKWKREIEDLVPNSVAVILNDYTDVIKYDKMIRDKSRTEHLYLVVSKDKAKSNYDERPAVIWDPIEETFKCPICGNTLLKTVGGHDEELQMDDMKKKYVFNQTCNYPYYTGENRCGAKLWTVLNSNDDNIKWIRISGQGWFHEDTIQPLIDRLMSYSSVLKKSEKKLLAQLLQTKREMEENKDFKRFYRASSKYSISTYIKKFYKGFIDYLIADEVHLLKGGTSLQGQSFDDFVQTANKTIALTGTLLNGYADSIFYLLYRTMPRVMQEAGFEYNSVNDFIREYGVLSDETTEILVPGDQPIRKTKQKKLPGISPIIFTKFLLENAVFISLSDMSEGLPSYSEHPIGLELEDEVKDAYNEIERVFRDFNNGISTEENAARNRMLKRGRHNTRFMQLMSIYPDQPYNNEPVVDVESNTVLFEPQDILKNGEVSYRNNKLEKTVEITKEKIENGENVLIFVSWTNMTDNQQLILDRMKAEGFNAEIMQNIAPDKREKWIKDKVDDGMQVMICNPKLVETGLDLLDFTTIIFYQLGYDIYTMRQASRRSWRLSQEKDIDVYFLYYEDTIQEKVLSMMARKLKASMAIEGSFSEEGLRAMSDNSDLMSQIANSIINEIEEKVEIDNFSQEENRNTVSAVRYKRRRLKFNKDKLYAGSHQRKNNSRRLFEQLLKKPLEVVNML